METKIKALIHDLHTCIKRAPSKESYETINELINEYRNHNNKIEGISDTDLIMELIRRHKLKDCPIKSTYAGAWHECLVPIENDNTVQIRLTDDDLNKMAEIDSRD